MAHLVDQATDVDRAVVVHAQPQGRGARHCAPWLTSHSPWRRVAASSVPRLAQAEPVAGSSVRTVPSLMRARASTSPGDPSAQR